MSIILIDGSNVRAGGSVTHLTELINNVQPEKFGIEKIIVCSSKKTLDGLVSKEWLIKIEHRWLEKSLFFISLWQLLYREKLLKSCDLLVSVSGNYSGKFRPYVSYCRNMLIFDKKERDRFPRFSLTKLRYHLLYYFQTKSFKNAHTTIFLCNHAKTTVHKYIKTKNDIIIHHGISDRFRKDTKPQSDINSYDENKRYKLLYVSIINLYKHQWNVVEAIAALIKKGYPLELHLVGGFYLPAMKKLEKTLSKIEPYNKYIHYHNKVSYQKIDELYKAADAFIFASTCENMPNIVLEAMAAGLPILSSDYPTIVEALADCGAYFDPNSISSIEQQLEKFIKDASWRMQLAQKAQQRSELYSWNRCAQETFSLLNRILIANK